MTERFEKDDLDEFLHVDSPFSGLRYGEGISAISNVYDLISHFPDQKYLLNRFLSQIHAETGLYDLSEIIRLYGGKNFGDMLLHIFYGENSSEVEEVCSQGKFASVEPNRTFYVGTQISSIVESVCREKGLINKVLGYMGRRCHSVFKSEDYLFLSNHNISKFVVEELMINPDIVGMMEEVIGALECSMPDCLERSLRIRGSQVYEDWLDTGLAGVSPGGHYSPDSSLVYYKTYLSRHCNVDESYIENAFDGDFKKRVLMINLLSTYVKFFYKKFLSQLVLNEEGENDSNEASKYSFVDYPKDEALALQIAPCIDLKRHVTAVIEEENCGDVIRMDVKLGNTPLYKSFEDMFVRVEVFPNGEIKICPGFDMDEKLKIHEGFLLPHLFYVNGQPSFIAENQIRAIADLMRAKKNFFGFAVDCELGIDSDSKVFDFQTRLAPTKLGVSGEVSLASYKKVTDSNFVLGQRFLVKSKVLHVENLYVMAFYDFEKLLEIIGDPQDYILLLDAPIATYMSFLMRLFCERGLSFAGVIDLHNGLDLTHSKAIDGGTYFLRHGFPVVGKVESPDEILKMLDVTVAEVQCFKSSLIRVSSSELIMSSKDGIRASIYAV